MVKVSFPPTNPNLAAQKPDEPAKSAQAEKVQQQVKARADSVAGDLAPRLFEAARARDVGEVKTLLKSWVDRQTEMTALSDGLLALSNFLRVFGSDEKNPKLYTDIMGLEAPKDRPFDAGTLDLKASALDQLGTLLQAIGKGHLKGEIDIQSGDNAALKGLLIASALGLQTDALKVKMVGWNKLTPQLANAHVSFELGIRKLPSDMPNTNFFVVGGVNKAIEWVKNLRVSPEAVEWMKGHPLFKNYPQAFFDYFSPPVDAKGVRVPGGASAFEQDLKKVKIEALSDGEIYVGGPIMRVEGPPAVVEFLETNLMRLVTSWTTVATAAAQMTIGADGKPVSYFGPRRAPGGDDTTEAISKAAALGGMTVSSDLLAGYLGHAITGTMEHSIMLMLKTIFRHDPPRTFTAEERKAASDYLSAIWKADPSGLSDKDVAEKVKAQLEDVLLEAHIFKEYAFKYDRDKSVALVDTSHPNVGTAAAMLAQHMIWAEKGKGPENNLSAVRIDSGNLLAQGLVFRKALDQGGMGHMRILATDGLLPETVKFFEKVEDLLQQVTNDKLPAAFHELMKAAPKSVAEDDAERNEIIKAAEGLAAAGGLKAGQALFAGYGAGEKIADSVSTVGRPGIVYKASQLSFEGADGKAVTVDMGKLASPSKATGPNREVVAQYGPDGKIARWVIASPSEVGNLPGKSQRLMRTVLENGQMKANPSPQKAVEYAASRRALLTEGMKEGKPGTLGMTAQYKKEWLDVVRATDPSRVEEFRLYIDRMWPTIDLG